MTGSHHIREFPLPCYFKHPVTGVVIEVDREGVTTFAFGEHGNFRPYSSMKDPIEGDWNSASEILTLINHGWRRA